MKLNELYSKLKELHETLKEENEFYFFGVRFENKDREIGEIITDNSRNNIDRDDEREFPEYGTDEYLEMEEFDGVSAWDLNEFKNQRYSDYEANKNADDIFIGKHCYVLASDYLMNTSNTIVDDFEIVMQNAKVMYKLY